MTAVAPTRPRPSRRRVIAWSLAGLALLVALCVLWVGVRASLARDELDRVVPLVARAQTEILSGDATAAALTLRTMADHAHTAESLTGDPIFALGSALPVAGPNLGAFREVTVAVDRIMGDALLPLADLAPTVTADAVQPENSTIDLEPIVAAAPTLATSADILDGVAADVRAIDTSSTLGRVRDSVERLEDLVDTAASAVTTLADTANLLPKMLGDDGPRNYLLMFQNNAELRATGGLPGALAVLTTDGGAFRLSTQATAASFPRFPAAVLPIDAATEALYGTAVATQIQNVGYTPDFPTGAALASEMWRQRYGTQLDGVIAVDPVVLGHLLNSTGPLNLATGDSVDSSTVVAYLLSEVYAKYSDPRVQDLVFAEGARASFAALSSGTLDPAKLISAVVESTRERRLLIWSAHPDEQAVLADSTFAGTLPDSNHGAPVIGVYFNDITNAKMDFYFDAQPTVAAVACDTDRMTYRTTVSLSSRAPADAAATLSPYVTGDGVAGVPEGTIRTRALVYGPVGSTVTAATVNGSPVTVQVVEHLGRQVAQVVLDLAPGEIVEFAVDSVGEHGSAADTVAELRMTPLIIDHDLEPVALACPETR